MVKFKKLAGGRKPAYIVNQILEAVRCGDIASGDRLPPEGKLAELTGVSRSSVREALSALRLLGVVETRAGDGTYLREFKDVDGVKSKLLTILAKNERTLQLQEAQAAFECGIMKLAAENIDAKDINNFKEILAQMQDAAELDHYNEFIDLHKKFHLAIARATKNVVIEEIIANFASIMDSKMWKALEKKHYLPDILEFLRESIEIHGRISQALEERDAALATKRMEEHFERYR